MHRSMLLGALALLAIAQAAPVAAQTTTTSSNTTTTTLQGACTPGDVTLPGLACSLDAYLATVRDARDADTLGRLGKGMVSRLEKGVTDLERAQRYCADADGKRAGKRVQQAGSFVTKTVAKIRSNNGRKIIPPDIARALASQGEALAADLKRVRKSISCP